MEKNNIEQQKPARTGKSLGQAIVTFFFVAWIVQLCLNFLTKELPITFDNHAIHLPRLQYSHALILYMLSNILFKKSASQETPKAKVESKQPLNEEQVETLKRTFFN